MKVKWNQFAKRRNITLDMFKDMSYEDYCDWCENRKVEPVVRDSYEPVRTMLMPTEEPTIISSVTDNGLEEKRLKKLKKSTLEKLCVDYEVEYSLKDTKKTLIQKLLHVNN